jgi:hypothetical protein
LKHRSRLQALSDFVFEARMKTLRSMLDPKRFLRVHRNAIVNLDPVKELYLPQQEICSRDSKPDYAFRASGTFQKRVQADGVFASTDKSPNGMFGLFSRREDGNNYARSSCEPVVIAL